MRSSFAITCSAMARSLSSSARIDCCIDSSTIAPMRRSMALISSMSLSKCRCMCISRLPHVILSRADGEGSQVAYPEILRFAQDDELSETSRDVVFRHLLFRIHEDRIRLRVLDDLAEHEERRAVGDARGLLHVVRDDDDRVGLLQIPDQLLDLRRGDRIERRGRLVHQQDLRIDRQRAGDAQPLLLAARERERRLVQAVLHLVPQRRALQRRLHRLVELLLLARAADAQAVGDVVVDRLRERVRLLEDHADAAAQRHDVGAGRVDVFPVDLDRPLAVRVRDDVVHPVDGADERRLPAARRPDQRGDLRLRDLQVDPVEHLRVPVVEIEVVHADFRGHGRFILSSRRTASLATIDSARMIITSRNAPAHACRCWSSYGEIPYVNTCTVSEAIGWVMLVDQYVLLSAVNSSGAVSPATRARATRMPVRMPGSAAGRMTEKTARLRVAPRASAPSRNPDGTRRSNSSVVRTTIGSIGRRRGEPSEIALKCLTGRTARAYAKMPLTIDGTPFSTSAAKRTADEKRVPEYSERCMPAMQPTGTANSAAMPMRISVPTMALAMPPPISPSGLGVWMKNARFSELRPSLMT